MLTFEDKGSVRGQTRWSNLGLSEIRNCIVISKLKFGEKSIGDGPKAQNAYFLMIGGLIEAMLLNTYFLLILY
jgi:hypothetical protein